MKDMINKIVLGFVTLIIGVIIISLVSSSTNSLTTKSLTSNETISISGNRIGGTLALNESKNITVANPPTGWEVQDCPLTNFVYRNQTGATLTDGVDYNITEADGKLQVYNVPNLNSSASNTTTTSYNYCADGYVITGWQRNVINLIGGFFALALLGVSVGFFYSAFKDNL